MQEYRQLVNTLLLLRDAAPPSNSEDILECTTKLLLLNPDFMTAWNLRRRVISSLAVTQPDRIVAELEFGVAAIRANPKSYGAWYHRKWLVCLMNQSGVPFIVTSELKLCNKLLELDSRNCKFPMATAQLLTASSLLELSLVPDGDFRGVDSVGIRFHHPHDLP